VPLIDERNLSKLQIELATFVYKRHREEGTAAIERRHEIEMGY